MEEMNKESKSSEGNLTRKQADKLKVFQGDQGRSLTFGERAVGLTFNPSQNPQVKAIKEQYAATIDMLNDLRKVTEDKEIAQMLSVAITDTQTAQMWAVKAITWN